MVSQLLFSRASPSCGGVDRPARLSLLPVALPLGIELLRSPLAAAAAADDDVAEVWLPDKRRWSRALFLCFCLSASSSSAFPLLFLIGRLSRLRLTILRLLLRLRLASRCSVAVLRTDFSAAGVHRPRQERRSSTYVPTSERRGAAQAIGASRSIRGRPGLSSCSIRVRSWLFVVWRQVFLSPSTLTPPSLLSPALLHYYHRSLRYHYHRRRK